MTDDMSLDKETAKKGLLAPLIKKGYKINPWIVRASFIPVILIFIAAFWVYGSGDYWVIRCPDDWQACNNPAYYDCDFVTHNCLKTWDEELYTRICREDPVLCQMPTVPGGFVAGHPPPSWFDYWFLLVLIFPLIGVIINHLVYNRGVKLWN